MLDHNDLVGAVSPARLLGHFEEIPVVLVTAELWSQRLFLRICATQNQRTRALDATWAREMERFAHEVQAVKEQSYGARPELPEQPGAVLNRIPLVVNDDLGTDYRSNGRSAGGTGSEWRSEWSFEPGVPTAATVLTVRLDTPDGSRLACQVPRQDFVLAH